ncbi:glycoside hydrolase family 3 protein [Brachybacterium muris]|uniref:glycoside hydrolase family 3 protein n=1 Tax=Brachybacterium muris TaxID=219301 RepID=UPI00223BBA98|nr:glycoside hydrolase family 3 C-terminal domain-containing protein [Brachybacterium muris]
MSETLLSQKSTTAEAGDRTVDPALADASRALAARGTVLLTNDGTLPLAAGTRTALFGRIQKDWIAVGYGSGGDVNPPYVTNLLDSLRESGSVQVDEQLAARYEAWCAENPADPGEIWGAWPRHYPEMPLEDAAVNEAARRNDVAVVVIGRAAGEDRDAVLEPGSYYLTDEERGLLAQVTEAFERTVVVVDTGNLIDLAWLEEFSVDALALAWAGGMEAGNAIADVLTGAVEPGGRLTATIARRYEDCPAAPNFGDAAVTNYAEDIFVGYRYFETFAQDAVLFPFGFGLGYTEFDLSPVDLTTSEGTIQLSVRVTNTGGRPGSEVVQAYVEVPGVALSQPARALAAYARTPELAPGESHELRLSVDWADIASYDDAGVTGHRSAFVLEPGTYRFHVGHDVRRTSEAGTAEVLELRVVEQLEEAAAVDPEHGFDRMVVRTGADGRPEVGYEPVPSRTESLRERILSRLPGAVAAPEGEQPSFQDVLDGSVDLGAFIGSLTPRELSDIAYGDVTMDSPLGAAGNAGAIGGVSAALRARGVIPAITTDGPSGIRIADYASLLPCGTALASAWDPAAVRELSALHGQEMLRKGSDILLGPGMNIHRDPLCGRNFEYFSEDPLVSGLTGAAQVAGIQSQGVAACPKHFACNNKEFERIWVDARVSERALREIYLRGFRIMVRESSPWTIMTSYNKINGVWGHYHYDLVTTILRGEWGFEGLVMTDWWMRMAQDPDFPALRDSAYRVRAGVDVLMPGSIEHSGATKEDSVYESHRSPDGLTLGEMQRTARHVLTYLAAVHPQGHRMGRGERPED